ncbi:YncE family protein [Methyloceanibacter superfactus]|uniref:YncE family protein n=1 Tax=Methyloceanibacter superfactus TaxID=1774969 RepID=UPI0009F1C6EF|nr:hypothetical protein [Methyloceanibacter superfactus]
MLATLKRLAAAVAPLVLASAIAASAQAAAPLLYVTNQTDNSVLVIDTGSDAKVATLAVASGPAMITAAPGGRHIYITHPEAGQISILDGHRLGVPRLLDVGGAPFGIAVASDGRLFVSDWNRNLLLVLDGETGSKIAEISVGHAPAHVALRPRAGVPSSPIARTTA